MNTKRPIAELEALVSQRKKLYKEAQRDYRIAVEELRRHPVSIKRSLPTSLHYLVDEGNLTELHWREYEADRQVTGAGCSVVTKRAFEVQITYKSNTYDLTMTRWTGQDWEDADFPRIHDEEPLHCCFSCFWKHMLDKHPLHIALARLVAWVHEHGESSVAHFVDDLWEVEECDECESGYDESSSDGDQ